MGALTSHLDAVQILVAIFFLCFGALIFYLRREDKREGYPMTDISPARGTIEGFPPMPPPKTYMLLEGGQMPSHAGPAPMSAAPLLRFPAAPLVPIGDPMFANVGPGAYPMRKDKPMTMQGDPQVQPLRVAHEWKVSKGMPDPRGMRVFDARGVAVGTVRDLWVDRSVKILLYLELELETSAPASETFDGRWVLLPIYHANIRARRGTIRVSAIMAHQFAGVPGHAQRDEITAREEDRLNAYYAAGLLYSRGNEGGLRHAPGRPAGVPQAQVQP
jgi:photosynthetic reaction center H subunit